MPSEPIVIPHKIKRPNYVLVGDFFERNKDALKMKLIGTDAGFSRKITEPSVNRPGLALCGFFTYFAYKRVQVMGNSEISYLSGLEPELAAQRFRTLCLGDIPCLVVARERRLPREFLDIAEETGISLLQSSMVTMKFLNAATIRLDWAFAPTTVLHGCLVDVQGVGVLIMGQSGSGKSEAVLGLLERGASMVADDVVNLRLIEEREIQGSAPELTRNMMEVRGIGLLNVAAIFGVGAVRLSKRLDLIVRLMTNPNLAELERVGVGAHSVEVLGHQVPLMEVPVIAGRDVGGLIEIAALNHKLRTFGYNAAAEFDQRLLKKMTDEQSA
ncbi:aldolase [Verrucomicrobiaceae bacterium SCGC AG-212-N21]|nr:aldolase [Verrucomicrobiaceae bacterium SCGC AG-212-N21]